MTSPNLPPGVSEKPRFAHPVAMQVAAELCAELSPSCERIAVAGSLRRRKPMVSDIEILLVGKTEKRRDPADMFAWITVNLADEAIASLEKSGVLERRLNVNGHATYGPKNKLMRHVASGIPVDLFSTTAEAWWVALVIRTGSKETNLRLTTGAQRQGATLHAYGSGITWGDGTQTVATSERHVFEMCGVEYVEPEKR